MSTPDTVWIVYNPHGKSPNAVLASEELAQAWIANNPTVLTGAHYEPWHLHTSQDTCCD